MEWHQRLENNCCTARLTPFPLCFCRCTTGSGNLNAFTEWRWRSCPITASARLKNGRRSPSSTSLHPFIKRLRCEWPLTSSMLMKLESSLGSLAMRPVAPCRAFSPVPRWPPVTLLLAWAPCQNWYADIPMKHPPVYKSQQNTKQHWWSISWISPGFNPTVSLFTAGQNLREYQTRLKLETLV